MLHVIGPLTEEFCKPIWYSIMLFPCFVFRFMFRFVFHYAVLRSMPFGFHYAYSL